jgi:hypothetical protein
VLEDFQTLAAMTPHLGLDAWYILIDKVDEDEHTDSDAGKAARLVLPLLKNLRTLETPYVAFKFFLWNQLRAILTEEAVRFDKIRNVEMSWTDAELREMIKRRVHVFSRGKVKDLTEIVDAGESVYPVVIKYATSSPREIVQVLDAIFSEHARHSTTETGAMITADSVARGLDQYSLKRVRDMYPPETIRQILRLPKVLFASSDIQTAFRKSKGVVSTKINYWLDNGYIKRVSDTQSIKDPSKTVYQYEVSEPRIRRIMERGLMKEDGEDASREEPDDVQ